METIIVSACLLGDKCRYDGKDNYNENVKFLKEHFDIVPICPEQFGGLTTPRDPSEQKDGKVISSKGRDVTRYFNKGRDDVLNIVKYLHIRKAVLVENSPSCGLTHVYNGRFNKTLIKGEGVTTKALRELGVQCYSIDEVEKLIDLTPKQIFEEKEAIKAEKEAKRAERNAAKKDRQNFEKKEDKKFEKRESKKFNRKEKTFEKKDSKNFEHKDYKKFDRKPRNSSSQDKKDFDKKGPKQKKYFRSKPKKYKKNEEK